MGGPTRRGVRRRRQAIRRGGPGPAVDASRRPPRSASGWNSRPLSPNLLEPRRSPAVGLIDLLENPALAAQPKIGSPQLVQGQRPRGCVAVKIASVRKEQYACHSRSTFLCGWVLTAEARVAPGLFLSGSSHAAPNLFGGGWQRKSKRLSGAEDPERGQLAARPALIQ